MFEVKRVFLSRLILHDDNPRFEGLLEEAEAIEALCKGEKVLELAKDIVENGLSPLERFMVFQEDTQDDPGDVNFVVAEGNRRLCALKLLKDPKKSPSQHREVFKKLARKYKTPRKIEVVVVEDEDERKKWITRAHAGASNGLGRKQWDTTQKTRYFQNPRNLRGQAILDYAVKRKFIETDDAEKMLSHLVRLIGNPIMRSTLGLRFDKDPNRVSRDRPLEDFDKLLTWLLNEAKYKRLGSQAKSGPISDKAKRLETELECSTRRLGNPTLLSADLIDAPSGFPPNGAEPSTPRPSSPGTDEVEFPNADQDDPRIDEADSGSTPDIKPPTKPQPGKKLPYSPELDRQLNKLGNHKLRSLFYSLSQIPMRDHVPALYVVAWAFLDSLSVALGRHLDGNIKAHWGKKNLSSRANLGYSKQELATIEAAIVRVHQFGNETKHDKSAAGFDAAQLSSDWGVVLPILESDLREHLKK